ncbi:heavy metal-responsive transcriptional regulator [Myxacorys almedinensis]|uniref:MerR family DNA-binding protein n=1 Tax=Myxacorys almedinensis A TaxID=2690445 RepID=A0A8J7Z1R4_9CYAN|nr:heavy metal-responsive transcriptional regulator [Myxacorys almedinensis]NDJ16196.1 MerR family DNA-binding protein [Myxacorys almedinensis A]
MNAVKTPLLLRIGEVSAQSSLPIKTIRYYDEIGLLSPAVERSQAGYRLFRPLVIERLGFIKRAQSLGLSLTEVKDILEVHDQGQLPCDRVKQQIHGKVQTIDQQIRQLQALRAELQDLLNDWQEEPSAHLAETLICPNIETL